MRIGKGGWAIAFVVLAGVAWQFWPQTSDFVTPSFAGSTEDRSVFYRLVSKYQHGDETIDFDIVVGCAVRVTRYGDGDKSFDAFRDPVVYIKAIGGGHALLQIVPDACRGQTTENGEVPDDFLPGALWFEHADDLSLGIAYVTEDAFDSSRSELKFLGASIRPATRADYVAFAPAAARNLMDPRPLFAFVPLPDWGEVRRSLGDSRALTKLVPGMDCNAVMRLHLTDSAERAIVRQHWPSSEPQYWMPSERELNELDKQLHLFSRMLADGREVRDYLRLNYNVADGFPTRAQGGRLGSKHKSWDKLPPTVFPLRRDEGIPWVTKDFSRATSLFRDVETLGGANKGFAYCYAQIPPGRLDVPASSTGNFVTRVDGELIFGESSDARSPRNRPWPFFERDEYFYCQDTFGLN